MVDMGERRGDWKRPFGFPIKKLLTELICQELSAVRQLHGELHHRRYRNYNFSPLSRRNPGCGGHHLPKWPCSRQLRRQLRRLARPTLPARINPARGRVSGHAPLTLPQNGIDTTGSTPYNEPTRQHKPAAGSGNPRDLNKNGEVVHQQSPYDLQRHSAHQQARTRRISPLPFD